MNDVKKVTLAEGGGKMDVSGVSGILKGISVIPGVGPVGDLLSQLEDGLSQDAIVAAILGGINDSAFPVPFLNRLNLRVDIYGRIADDTHEYEMGHRFYDSYGNFYSASGRAAEVPGVDQYDLVSLVDDALLPHTHTPTSALGWVHPQHRVDVSFFKTLVPNQDVLTIGSTYLNRMGFVVTLNHGTPVGEQKVFRDVTGRMYYDTCRCHPDRESMGDLVFQIVNFDLFSSASWTSSQITQSARDDHAPELFNPMTDSRQMVMEDFFRTLLHAKELATRLDISFGFHMNDPINKR